MPKTNMMISMEVGLRETLKKESVTRMRSMTALVEDGLRLLFALPAPEAVEPEAEGLSQRQALLVLEKLGAKGWHSVIAISKLLGNSEHVTEKALRGLALNGQVFLWGEGFAEEENDCRRPETRWGLRDPVVYVGRMLKGWLQQNPAGITYSTARTANFDKLIGQLRAQLTGASEEICKACSDLARETFGYPGSDMFNLFERTPSDDWVFRHDEHRRYLDSPEYAAAKAAEEAAQRADIDRQIAAQREQEAMNRAEDARWRAENRPTADDELPEELQDQPLP